MAFNLGGWLELGGRFVLDESTDSQISIFSPAPLLLKFILRPLISAAEHHFTNQHCMLEIIHALFLRKKSLHTFFDHFSRDLNI